MPPEEKMWLRERKRVVGQGGKAVAQRSSQKGTAGNTWSSPGVGIWQLQACEQHRSTGKSWESCWRAPRTSWEV